MKRRPIREGRPPTVRDLSSTGTHGITKQQIDAMTDDHKGWLKQNRPEVWQWYLGK